MSQVLFRVFNVTINNSSVNARLFCKIRNAIMSNNVRLRTTNICRKARRYVLKRLVRRRCKCTRRLRYKRNCRQRISPVTSTFNRKNACTRAHVQAESATGNSNVGKLNITINRKGRLVGRCPRHSYILETFGILLQGRRHPVFARDCQTGVHENFCVWGADRTCCL